MTTIYETTARDKALAGADTAVGGGVRFFVRAGNTSEYRSIAFDPVETRELLTALNKHARAEGRVAFLEEPAPQAPCGGKVPGSEPLDPSLRELRDRLAWLYALLT